MERVRLVGPMAPATYLGVPAEVEAQAVGPVQEEVRMHVEASLTSSLTQRGRGSHARLPRYNSVQGPTYCSTHTITYI